MELVGIAVMSLDGCLTRHDRAGTGFASKADHAFFRAALQTFDSTLVGRRTYEASRQGMLRAREAPRLQVVLTSTPARFEGDARPERLEFRAMGVGGAVAELTSRGRARCALLGGTRLYTEALERSLLDELWVTVEPIVFGSGVRMFEGRIDGRFAFSSSETLAGSTLLLKYRARGGGAMEA